MAPLCAVLGATSHGLFNSLRRRPAMYQPWWHVILGTVGWLGGDYLGRLYDSTGDELNRQYQSVGRLPSWMHGKLSEEELSEFPPESKSRRDDYRRQSAQVISRLSSCPPLSSPSLSFVCCFVPLCCVVQTRRGGGSSRLSSSTSGTSWRCSRRRSSWRRGRRARRRRSSKQEEMREAERKEKVDREGRGNQKGTARGD